MKFKISTFGCRNNQYESAEIAASMEKEGFQAVSLNEQADICVINTCSVTEKSNYRCRQLIRKTVDSNPESFIVVAGCYPQIETEAIKSLPGVNLILGNEEKLDVAKFLKDLDVIGRIPPGPPLRRGEIENSPNVFVGNMEEENTFQFNEVNHFAGKTKAFLKVQTGCNYTCSFCVITLARGNSRSATPEEVVSQFKKLLQNGFKEISLTGIHLGSYGKDISPSTNLTNLLKLLINIEGDFRIRLSSLGPKDVDDELISLMADSPKICNHLHLSLQSGSDKILRLMERNYLIEDFYSLVHKISNRIPDIGIGADLIAGFPGENEEAFEETLRVIKEIPFSYLHVFNFSRRKMTVAYDLPEQVPKKIRKERVSILKELGQQKTLAFKKKFLGESVNVLVEDRLDLHKELLKGHTENFMPVHLSGTKKMINNIVPVRLSYVEDEILYGKAL